MRRFKFNELVSTIVPVLVSLTCYGDDELPVPADPPLTFAVECRTSEILPYEPVPLLFIVRNTSEHPVKTTLGIGRFECISVQYEDEPFQHWRRGWMGIADVARHQGTMIPAGYSLTLPIEIVWQKSYPVFHRVGKYRIKAAWHGTLGEFAAVCEVVVKSGNDRERECLEQILARRLEGYLGIDAKFVLGADVTMKRRPNWREDLRNLYVITRDYWDTPYGKRCLSTVLSILESRKLYMIKPEMIDADFKQSVVEWTEQRCGQQSDALTLYSFAQYLLDQDRTLKANRDHARELLTQAAALKADIVLAERISQLLRRAR